MNTSLDLEKILNEHGWQIIAESAMCDMLNELTTLRRFKAAALTLTSEASVEHVMSKEKA